MGPSNRFVVFFLSTLLLTTVSSGIFAPRFEVNLLQVSVNLADFPEITIEGGLLSIEPSKYFCYFRR